MSDNTFTYDDERYGSLLMHIDRNGSKWSDRRLSERYVAEIEAEERRKLRIFLGGDMHEADNGSIMSRPSDYVDPINRRYPGWVRNTADDFWFLFDEPNESGLANFITGRR